MSWRRQARLQAVLDMQLVAAQRARVVGLKAEYRRKLTAAELGGALAMMGSSLPGVQKAGRRVIERLAGSTKRKGDMKEWSAHRRADGWQEETGEREAADEAAAAAGERAGEAAEAEALAEAATGRVEGRSGVDFAREAGLATGRAAAAEEMGAQVEDFHVDDPKSEKFDTVYRWKVAAANARYIESFREHDKRISRHLAGLWDEQSWLAWEDAAWRKEIDLSAQTPALKAAYLAHAYRFDETARACAASSTGTAMMPGEWAAPEFFKFGGGGRDWGLLGILWRLFKSIHGEAENQKIGCWMVAFVSMMWKGKKDALLWSSYRLLAIGSVARKTFERPLLWRLQLLVTLGGDDMVHWLQAVSNGCLEARHNITLLHDVCLYRREVEKKGTTLLLTDIMGGYPQTPQEILWLRVRQAGVVGGGFETLFMLYGPGSNDVRLGMARGVFSRVLDRALGMGEGQIHPPVLFVIVASDLIADLEEAGVGVEVAEQIIAAFAFMDDNVTLVGDEDELIRAVSVIKTWCWRNGYQLALPKVELLRVLGPQESSFAGRVLKKRWSAGETLPASERWVPPLAEGAELPKSGMMASCFEDYVIEYLAKAKVLGVFVTEKLLWDAMALHLIGKCTARLKDMRGVLARLRGSLSREGHGLMRWQLLEGWIGYIRPELEWCWSVMGSLDGDTVKKLEQMQSQALELCAGAADADHCLAAFLRRAFGQCSEVRRWEAAKAGLAFAHAKEAAQCARRRAIGELLESAARAQPKGALARQGSRSCARMALAEMGLSLPLVEPQPPEELRMVTRTLRREISRQMRKAEEEAWFGSAAYQGAIEGSKGDGGLMRWWQALRLSSAHERLVFAELLRAPATEDRTCDFLALCGGTLRMVARTREHRRGTKAQLAAPVCGCDVPGCGWPGVGGRSAESSHYVEEGVGGRAGLMECPVVGDDMGRGYLRRVRVLYEEWGAGQVVRGQRLDSALLLGATPEVQGVVRKGVAEFRWLLLDLYLAGVCGYMRRERTMIELLHPPLALSTEAAAQRRTAISKKHQGQQNEQRRAKRAADRARGIGPTPRPRAGWLRRSPCACPAVRLSPAPGWRRPRLPRHAARPPRPALPGPDTAARNSAP